MSAKIPAREPHLDVALLDLEYDLNFAHVLEINAFSYNQQRASVSQQRFTQIDY